ncbi:MULTISPECIES: helix-turn-helix domain-containing protein [Brevibacillus]|uniref:helix-turn-helix domain-containing protein n=1 Tax=Brevibacillus TaxID=55080 RepID=UPI001C8DD61C|nr:MULTISPECIES: XRE family transcriptional regulator [Brevibacillus]MBY0086059.1 helix-turn-helix transcriptional regulator [Brevibacillus brevis]MCE0451714.1 helix-turn-helix transcriptional regulator [Brevibacillus sp. AF8]
MEPTIGVLIKSLRVGKKKTLKQIAEKTQLSISFLSQVERGKSSITLESLKKISEALGVSPGYFFSGESIGGNERVRRASRARSQLQRAPFMYEDLSGQLANPSLVPILVTLSPHGEKGTPFAHKGQEFIYVLEGVLTLLLGEEEHDLFPGDSIHMESSVPHNWVNRTGEVTKFLCVNSHDSDRIPTAPH